MFGGLCATEVLWFGNSVEAGAGDPCGCKETGAIDELDTMEVPENGHTEVWGSPCRKMGGSIAQSPPAPVHTAGATNRRSWTPLCSWETVAQLHHRHLYG